MSWVAVSYGALDLRGTLVGERAGDIVVTPVFPGEPVVLNGDVATLWLRLVGQAVDAASLTLEEHDLVRGFAEYGIASDNSDNPHRVSTLDKSWLSSPTHELVYALVAKVADAEDISVVFIKGPVLHAQGLRDREHSGDVDVWVEPGREEQLARALTPWGWNRHAKSALTGTVLVHSVPMRPPEWACEIDIHYSFPGIGLGAASAFDLLLQRSEGRSFAGIIVRTPDAASNAVIGALHYLRPRPGRPQLPHQLPAAADVLARAGESVLAIVEDYATHPVLAPALGEAFPAAPVPDSGGHLPAEWWWRTAPTVAEAFLRAARLTPWRRRPAVLFRLLWPTKEYAQTADQAAGGHAKGPTSARISRIVRGLKQQARGGGETTSQLIRTPPSRR